MKNGQSGPGPSSGPLGVHVSRVFDAAWWYRCTGLIMYWLGALVTRSIAFKSSVKALHFAALHGHTDTIRLSNFVTLVLSTSGRHLLFPAHHEEPDYWPGRCQCTRLARLGSAAPGCWSRLVLRNQTSLLLSLQTSKFTLVYSRTS